ncbi:MAG TPA: cupin domain-containing protein [Rhodanobacteraceae bacterium]|nr:cupin domain-containing protein [Rhodanobacteraceae bacterium]
MNTVHPASAQIFPAAMGAEYAFREGCHITERWNADADVAVSVAQARVAPGVTTRWHRLVGTVERYLIVSGSGVVEVGELAPQALTAGAAVLIPADTRQRIRNTGTTDLIFLAVCTPRFRLECYRDDDASPA